MPPTEPATKPIENYTLQAWEEIYSDTPPPVRDKVAKVVKAAAAVIADDFYQALFLDDTARTYLEHDKVNERLHSSMQHWLEQLFAVNCKDSFLAMSARQIQVGAVHARIKLPPYLMGVGVRFIRSSIRKHLQEASLTAEDFLIVQLYVSELLNLSDGLMMAAYVRDVQNNARSDEAYRSVAMRHDVSLERERSRASLSEWMTNFLYRTRLSGDTFKLDKLADSEFGIWFKHKAMVLFEDIYDTKIIMEVIEQIDDVLVPQFKAESLDPAEINLLLEELKSKLDFISYLLSDLFERLSSLNQGRDAITGLYSRQHLGAVLAREQQQHINSGHSFGVILVKIDNFEFAATDEESRSSLIRQLSTLIVEVARVGDHVFRYGNTEFLLLAVETHKKSTEEIASTLRVRILAQPFLLRANTPIQLTASIGISQFDGHPDYMTLLRGAENAVVKSAVAGGNQITRAWKTNS